MIEHGFLGNDASFMLDFVVCALLLVVPILAGSIYLVKFRQRFELHKKLQILLGVVLLIAVADLVAPRRTGRAGEPRHDH